MARRTTRLHAAVRIALAAVALAASAPALAQDEVNTPPQPNRGVSLTSPVGGYAIMALAAAAIVAVSLMPAKRGHQD
jgi:hypothetical protein